MRNGSLLSNSLIYGLGSVLSRVASLLMLPVFTEYLSPAEYGVVGLLNTFGLLLTPVFSLGIGTSIGVCYFATPDTSRREGVIRTALLILILSGALLVLTGIGFAPAIAGFVLHSAEYDTHVVITLIGVAFGLAVMPLQLRLQFENRPLLYVVSSLIGVATNLACSLVLVVEYEKGAAGLLVGAAIGQLSTFIVCALFCGTWPRLGDILSPEGRQLLARGIPMIPSFFLLFYLQNAVRWPLEWYSGLHDVGLYTVGSSFGIAMSVVTGAVTAAWLPYALRRTGDWEVARHELAKVFHGYFAWAGYLVLLFFILAQPFVRLFAANDYFEAWKVVGLVALVQFLISLFSMILPTVYMAKEVHKVNIPQLYAALAVTVLTPVLLPFKSLGAALVVFGGGVVLVAVTQLTVVAKIRDFQPIPYNAKLLAKVAVVLGSGMAASFSLDVDHIDNFTLIACAIVSGAGFFVLRNFPLPRFWCKSRL